MPEGFGHEYPLGGENVLKLQDALVCALDGVGTTRDIVSRNSATKNENGCPRNFITLLLEVLHLLNARTISVPAQLTIVRLEILSESGLFWTPKPNLM
jgi:hypothetical protein